LAVVPKFEGHPDNDVFVAVISFYGERRKSQGAHTGTYTQDHTHVFSHQKLLCWQSSMHQRFAILNQPGMLPQSFRSFWQHCPLRCYKTFW